MTYVPHFNFTGLNVCHESQISLRVPLGMTPTLDAIQQLLYDLYAQTRYAPQYLFMAMEDLKALSHEVMGRNGITPRHPRFMLVEEFGIAPGNVITKMHSHANGQLVNVVPLPDLDQGSVILGFFR